MFIQTEETPNPNTLKFIPENSLSIKGTKLYKATDDFEGSAVLETIFSVKGVTSVLLNSEFISISKSEELAILFFVLLLF